MNDCIFCKITQGAAPARAVYSDEKILAFLDIQPVNPGHVLIIPREHIEEIPELDPARASSCNMQNEEMSYKTNLSTVFLLYNEGSQFIWVLKYLLSVSSGHLAQARARPLD
jgi:hypothetical protein